MGVQNKMAGYEKYVEMIEKSRENDVDTAHNEANKVNDNLRCIDMAHDEANEVNDNLRYFESINMSFDPARFIEAKFGYRVNNEDLAHDEANEVNYKLNKLDEHARRRDRRNRIIKSALIHPVPVMLGVGSGMLLGLVFSEIMGIVDSHNSAEVVRADSVRIYERGVKQGVQSVLDKTVIYKTYDIKGFDSKGERYYIQENPSDVQFIELTPGLSDALNRKNIKLKPGSILSLQARVEE